MTSISILTVLVFIQVFTIASAGVDWTDCGTTLKITDLRIRGCSKQPCIFYEGKQYSLEFDAISKKPSKTLPFTVKAKFLVNVPILSGDACENLTAGSCPILASGQKFTFHRNFSADIPFFSFDRVPTTITAEMKDDFGKILLCAQLAVEIHSAKFDPNPDPPEIEPVQRPSFAQKFFNFFGA